MAHNEYTNNSSGLPESTVTDPTHRIDKLASATQGVIFVKPDTSIQETITTMLLHDFSQLPVMQSTKEVKGIVSWKSIGIRFNLGIEVNKARDCMDNHIEVASNTSIFEALNQVVEHDYVLIRSRDKEITGIVTASDIGIQFLQLGRPFWFLEEIEHQMRWIIDGKFTIEELATAVDPKDPREIKGVSSLNFGEYIRLLENPDLWIKTELSIDRKTFIKHLNIIREIRNKIMHFNPVGLGDEDLDLLQASVKFFRLLRKIKVSKK